MKFITFNVCGIKNLFCFKPWNEYKDLKTAFTAMNADIVCFQETKLQAQDLTKHLAVVEGYQSFFTFSTVKKGYSGVAVYVRSSIPVLAAEEGLSGDLQTLAGKQSYRSEGLIGGYPDISDELGRGIDGEGRCLVLDIGSCVLIGLYCPANSQGDKQDYRDLFFRTLDERVVKLRALGRKVVVLGDINVSPQARDSAEAQERFKKASIPVSEWDKEHLGDSVARSVVWSWLDSGFIDTTRQQHPDRKQMYTCWDLRVDGRGANFGSRIDLVLVSPDITCTAADIMLDIYGSDHCPVYADLDLAVSTVEGYKVPLLSRKRCAGFASIQSFWGASGKGGKAPLASLHAKAAVPVTPVVSMAPLAAQQEAKKPPSSSGSSTKTSLSAWKVTKQKPSRTSNTVDTEADELPTPKHNPESSAAWKQIFTQVKPKCLHGDDAKLQKCKMGPNRGRSFWSCARPKGTEGDPQFRCKYFQWS